MRQINPQVFQSALAQFNAEVNEAFDFLVHCGADRFVVRQELRDGQTFTIYGARYEGAEYMPASFSQWLEERTPLAIRPCAECEAHPRGRCDFCATVGAN